MNALRTNSTLRISLVLAAVVTWLVFSNRCALGQLFSPQQAVAVQHGCCEQKHGQPDQVPIKTDVQECCKAFHVLVGGGDKAPIEEVMMLAATIAFLVEIPAPAEILSVAATDAGPPGEFSFVELVLHRSLHSHAPPVSA